MRLRRQQIFAACVRCDLKHWQRCKTDHVHSYHFVTLLACTTSQGAAMPAELLTCHVLSA